MSRTVAWQGIWQAGAEWCEMRRLGGGWGLSGTAIMAVDGEPWQVRYEVGLDDGFATRHAQVAAATNGLQETRLRLRASNDRVWSLAIHRPGGEELDREVEGLRGLFDVDLGFSPSTNTLPIRRVPLAVGQAMDVTAVWVRYPELTVEPLEQRYVRLAERRYRYESGGGAFRAVLEVDDWGLVTSYEGGWQRIAST